MLNQFLRPVFIFPDQVLEQAVGEYLYHRHFGIERIVQAAPVCRNDLLQVIHLAVASLADKYAGINFRFFRQRRHFVNLEFDAVLAAEFTV